MQSDGKVRTGETRGPGQQDRPGPQDACIGRLLPEPVGADPPSVVFATRMPSATTGAARTGSLPIAHARGERAVGEVQPVQVAVEVADHGVVALDRHAGDFAARERRLLPQPLPLALSRPQTVPDRIGNDHAIGGHADPARRRRCRAPRSGARSGRRSPRSASCSCWRTASCRRAPACRRRRPCGRVRCGLRPRRRSVPTAGGHRRSTSAASVPSSLPTNTKPGPEHRRVVAAHGERRQFVVSRTSDARRWLHRRR